MEFLLCTEFVTSESDRNSEHSEVVRFARLDRRHKVRETKTMTCVFVRLVLLPKTVNHTFLIAALLNKPAKQNSAKTTNFKTQIVHTGEHNSNS
jgi:hypothetical protein